MIATRNDVAVGGLKPGDWMSHERKDVEPIYELITQNVFDFMMGQMARGGYSTDLFFAEENNLQEPIEAPAAFGIGMNKDLHSDIRYNLGIRSIAKRMGRP